MNKLILLTGASGFIGNSLAIELIKQGAVLRCAVRTPFVLKGAQLVSISAIDANTEWKHSLVGVDTVIHCAGRAHVMHDSCTNSLDEYRRINVEGTLNLARQAVQHGVKRFIFLSSVKVNGEQTIVGKPFTEEDIPRPQNPYAVSKYEAEQALLKLAEQTQLEVVIIRSTLVYGAGVKGNFFSLLKMIKRGIPLPFGAINNQRSFIYLENLHSLMMRCIDHPKAANQIFLVSDGQDLSTPELLRYCAAAMNVGICLMPIPTSWCTWSAALCGQKEAMQRLCGSLQVDMSKAKRLLDWEPPFTMQVGLHRTVGHF